jgi:long-chain acyl-CoA synthetase
MGTYKTLNEMFFSINSNNGNSLTYFSKDSAKKFHGVSFREAYTQGENLGLYLLSLGVSPGDRVGQMSDNSTEWAIADMAVLLNGACNVPRGSDSTAAEIEYILSHSEAKVCFIEHEKLLKTVLPIIPKTNVKQIIVLDRDYKPKEENVIGINEAIEKGKALRSSNLNELLKRARETKEDDLFTIIYTSGTTGLPKGVMLTHKNMIYNVATIPNLVGLKKGDRVLSILPVWHIFERANDYAMIASGAGLYFTNVRDLRDDFTKVKPTFMASAPRLWENLYAGIKQKVEKAEPLRQLLFNTSYEISKNFKKSLDYVQGNLLQTKEEDPFSKMGNTVQSVLTIANLAVLSRVADKVVFEKIREVLGGELRGTISGGGALPSHVDEFFNAIGIPVYEGYGMTECAPVISVRSVGHVVQGSVGFVPKGTEVKVLDDKGKEVPVGQMGVIHVKGPQVMKGYYKNPEATAKTIINGWLNTGDLGFKSFNGTLSVRGRVKDTIVLLGGENVEPVPIENLLLEHPHINQVIVVGQDQKSLACLIWPDVEKLKEAGWTLNWGDDLNKNEKLRSHYMTAIKDIISGGNGFKSFERISDFRFLPKAMEVGDELTNLYKMKRNVISDKYSSLIKDMYN